MSQSSLFLSLLAIPKWRRRAEECNIESANVRLTRVLLILPNCSNLQDFLQSEVEVPADEG